MKKSITKAIFPLSKGLDLNSIPGSQAPSALTKASGIVLKTRNSLKKRPGGRRLEYVGNDSGVQAAIQFFATSGTSQIEEIVRVRNGRVEVIRDGAVRDLGVQVSPTDHVTFERFDNVLIIFFENTAPYYYTVGGSLTTLPILTSHLASPPYFARVHNSRLWYAGRRSNPHTAWVSAVDDPFTYSLQSGGFNISVKAGDGDPLGLTGFSPTFRGDLYAFKWGAVYRLPLTAYGYGVEVLTDAVGSVGHNTIVATPNDIIFVSNFAIHSLSSTDKFGAAEEATITFPIFDYFQEIVNWSAYKSMVAVYDRKRNSYLLSFISSGSSSNDRVIGFNVLTKEFYEWESTEYPALGKYYDFGKTATMVGSNSGIGVLDDDLTTDFGEAIESEIKTGVLFPMETPIVTGTFSNVWLLARPTPEEVSINLTYYVDGFEIETITFSTDGGGTGAIIGDDDAAGVIGEDLIGFDRSNMVILGSALKGQGRSIEFKVTQSPDNNASEDFELYGIVYQFEYEEDQLKKTGV